MITAAEVIESPELETTTKALPNEVAEDIKVEQTVCLVKPDAYGNGHLDSIVEQIISHGFSIEQGSEVHFSRFQAEQFYKEHSGKPFYEKLVTWMSSAPIYAMVLEKSNAIADWRKLAGPTNSEEARKIAPERLYFTYLVSEHYLALMAPKMLCMVPTDLNQQLARSISSLEEVYPVPKSRTLHLNLLKFLQVMPM